ncbi:hypothetical protein ACPJHQ_03710 [Rossellomorea sp. H39__3]
MKWDFTFSAGDTTQRYRNYHRSSSHAPLMQMRKAPRREYEVRDLDSKGKRVKWHMDPGRFDQAGGKTFADVMKNRRTSWNFGERDVTEEELKELLLFSFGISEPLEKSVPTLPAASSIPWKSTCFRPSVPWHQGFSRKKCTSSM